MSPGKEYLRSLRRLLYVCYVHLDPVIDIELLAGDLLLFLEYSLCSSDVDEDRLSLLSLDAACENLSDLIYIIIVDKVSLGFFDPLQSYLLGRLSSDPSEVSRLYLKVDVVADLIVRIDLLRLFEGYLIDIAFDFLYYVAPQIYVDLSGLLVDLDPYVLVRSVYVLVSGQKRSFDSLKNSRFGDPLFFFDLFDRFNKLFVHFSLLSYSYCQSDL